MEQCQKAGLVWGRELYIDATKVQANAPSGSNHYSLRAKTGMGCGVFACDGSGASTVKHSCEQRDKISSACSKGEAGDGVLTQQKPFVPSFWLFLGG